MLTFINTKHRDNNYVYYHEICLIIILNSLEKSTFIKTTKKNNLTMGK